MSNSYFFGESIFSAGGVLFDDHQKKVLLVYKEAADEWLLPKGRMEANETIEETATREIYEETGYKNMIVQLLSVQVRPDMVDPTKSKVIFWFLSKLTDEKRDQNTQAADENFTGKWCDREEALKLLKWDEDKKKIEIVFKLIV